MIFLDFCSALPSLLIDTLTYLNVYFHLNSTSHLASLKGTDLKSFLEKCFGIAYERVLDFAPSEELLKEYQNRLGKKRKDDVAWANCVGKFQHEVLSRPVVERFRKATDGLSVVCLLCYEETADRCHRRLLAEHFKNQVPDIELQHL